MSIKLMLVNTFFSLITAYFIFFFIKANFKMEINRTRLILFIVCFGVVNGILSTKLMSYLPSNLQFAKSIILFVLSIVITKSILKVDLIKAIISFCIIMLGVALGNFSVPLIFYIFGINATPDTITNNIYLFFAVNVFIYIVALIFVLLAPIVKKIGKVKNLNPVGFLLAVTILMMATNVGIHYITSFDPVSFLVSLLSSLFYFIASIWYINKYHNYEMKIEEQNQQAFYNESLALTLQDLRRIKHDQANHLTVINSMLHMNKYKEAVSYLKEIIDANEVNTAVFNIKNAGLFGIITSKINKANKLGIRFDLKTIGTIESIPNVKISDLCEILGIYLDNAIEAAQDCHNKLVEMSIMVTDTNIDITIMNSCLEEPIIDKIKVDGYSTKGTDRGHGLMIVEKILLKYNDILNIIRFNKEKMQFVQTLKIKKGI